MTARIVIYSSLTARPNYEASFHRERPLGIPACGVPLRNPRRAIAVDDGRLCATCWGEIGGEQTFEIGGRNARIAGKTKDVKRPQQSVFAHRPGPDHHNLKRAGS